MFDVSLKMKSNSQCHLAETVYQNALVDHVRNLVHALISYGYICRVEFGIFIIFYFEFLMPTFEGAIC